MGICNSSTKEGRQKEIDNHNNQHTRTTIQHNELRICILTLVSSIVVVACSSSFPFPFVFLPLDVRRDRERTRGAHSGQPQATQQQAAGDRPRGQNTQIAKPQSGAQGMPVGSYRDANGIPRSMAVDQPIAQSYKQHSSMGEATGEYGTSYTNRKTKEYDLLNDIVKQTRNNFIDVSAKSGQLDEDDLLERGQKYVKNLSEIPTNAQSLAPSATSQSFGVYYSALDMPPPSSLIVKRTPAPSAASSLASNLAQARSTGEVDYNALVHILATAYVTPQDVEFITNASAQVAATIEAGLMQEAETKIVLTFDELLQA